MKQTIPPPEGSAVPTNGIQEKTDALLAFLIKNQSTLIAVSIVIVLAGGAMFYLQQQQRARAAESSILAAEAAAMLESGTLQQAIDGNDLTPGLRRIASDYRGTPGGNLAALMLGESLLNLDKPEEAEEVYNSMKGINKDLEAAAAAGRARALELQGKTAEAASALENAGTTARNKALSAIYLADAADLYLAAGKPDKAALLAEKLGTSHEGYSGAAKARQLELRIAALPGE
ncbi:tetratricopeptide repeat protein [Prosthecochloris sp. CIB 2401]|uniref:tetratricopeptide repeat protein n=1 Tax=Prosthecochloris sp. CIB 2401 TaxID=1868325 RepID=UPI00080AB614|nr:tetratricopeptide repeat protein [Prosthecochloris sp. CIB 2401]ANT65552.1 hypothetical protein Ptc2401_01818 [Prosthecochloris sp. CIB 2401]